MRSFFYGVSAATLGGIFAGMALTPALADLTRFDDMPTAYQPAVIIAQADVAPSSNAPWAIGTDYLKPPQQIVYAPIAEIEHQTEAVPEPDWSVPERPHIDYLAQAPAYPSETGDIIAAPNDQSLDAPVADADPAAPA